MQFTHQYLIALKPKTDRYEVQEPNGLGLRVTPTGQKSFIYRYRYHGRRRRMTLGPFPTLSLTEARSKRDDARKQLVQDCDPGQVFIEAKRHAREAGTVEELVIEYLTRWAKPNKRSWREDERILYKDIVPVWGKRKMEEITRRDVIRVLDSVMDRGAPISANRTFEVVRRMFRFAVERGILENTPCYAVRKPAKSRQRDRVLYDTEIKSFWENLEYIDASTPVKIALKFQLVTAQRRGEVTKAEWKDFDMNNGWWTIPQSHSKNQLAHHVPLSPLALELLHELHAHTGNTPYILPAPTNDKPMTDHAITRAVGRCRQQFGIDHFTPHDLRRTAASRMTSLGISRLVVAKILNHAESGVTAIYDRYSYDAEKVDALVKWADTIQRIVSGDQNIIQLRRSQHAR